MTNLKLSLYRLIERLTGAKLLWLDDRRVILVYRGHGLWEYERYDLSLPPGGRLRGGIVNDPHLLVEKSASWLDGDVE